MADLDGLRIQVCYTRPGFTFLRNLVVPEGTSLQDAIQRSGVLQQAPEIDLDTCKAGVYGRLKPMDALVREHDRVEIYRPLVTDPKDARRRRADRKQHEKE